MVLVWYSPSNNNISSIGLVLESFQNSQGNLCLFVSIQLNLMITFKVEVIMLVKGMYNILYTNLMRHGKVSLAMKTVYASSLHNANNEQESHEAHWGHKKKQSTGCMDNN